MSAKKSSSTQSGTTNQNISSTTTATNPDWVTNGVQGLTSQIGALGQTDPSQYVTGPSANQTAASTAAANQQSGQDLYGNVLSAIGGAPSVEAQSLLTNLDQYMSPYTNDVVNTTLADFDADAGATRAAQAAKGAGAGQAFGGSRWGVQEAATEGQLARARATADAQLRDQGFTQGAALSGQDADRRQSASAANATNARTDIGMMLGADNGIQSANAQNIGLLSSTGATDRDIANQQAQSGISLLQTQAGLLDGLPLNLFNGSSTNGTTSGTTTGTGTNTSIGASLGWNSKNGLTIGG